MSRVMPVSILRVAADRMPHVSCMDADLVLAPCFQAKLHQ